MIHTTILSESLLLPEEAMTEKKKIQKDAPSTLKLMTDFTWSFIKGRNCEQRNSHVRVAGSVWNSFPLISSYYAINLA